MFNVLSAGHDPTDKAELYFRHLSLTHWSETGSQKSFTSPFYSWLSSLQVYVFKVHTILNLNIILHEHNIMPWSHVRWYISITAPVSHTFTPIYNLICMFTLSILAMKLPQLGACINKKYFICITSVLNVQMKMKSHLTCRFLCNFAEQKSENWIKPVFFLNSGSFTIFLSLNKSEIIVNGH